MRLVTLVLMLLLLPSTVTAEPSVQNKNFEQIKACTPGTVDGSQVFENYWTDGECNGVDKRKKFLRVTDFDCEATCSVVGRECTHFSEMNTEQKAHYESLKKYRKVTLPKIVTCVQGDGETIRLDSATNATEHPCNPAQHATRLIDAKMGKCFVLFGEKTPIGSVTITNATELIKRKSK